jgi:hypothetical protein
VGAPRPPDDNDGHPDAEQDPVVAAADVDLLALQPRWIGAELRVTSGADRARLVVHGRPLAWGLVAPPGAVVQGMKAGLLTGIASRGKVQETFAIQVLGVGLRDGALKDVDLAREHASLERTPPERVETPVDARYDDPDALRAVLVVPDAAGAPAQPPALTIESIAASGASLDQLPKIALEPFACAKAARCFATAPLRFVVDDVDRTHPVVDKRSVRAEVGGAIVLRIAGRKQAIRVAGPRASAVGPIGRLRATLRPIVTRISHGGAPAIGGNDAGAVATLRTELALASAMWGQCGVTFGPAQSLDVKVVDPPPPHLVAFGDDLGLPATGGGELRVRADGKLLVVPIAARSPADRVAREFAAAATKAGFTAVVSPNARITPGAGGSVDVSLRRADGALVTIEAASPTQLILTDATLAIRIGSVDFSDGLQHFGDMDSMAGTLEERTLIKAFDDGDPRTIEIIVVASFAGGGRIGESFIQSDLSSVRNVVLLDRAGIRARRSSLTLAHELGHVFMNVPGHPDDFGLDTPTLLMDSDASDASPFGPRRLGISDCVRVVREAGPKARVPLFTDWPLTRLRVH